MIALYCTALCCIALVGGRHRFARYRDTKSKLHDKEAVYAACMVIATRELLEGTAHGHRALADIYTKVSRLTVLRRELEAKLIVTSQDDEYAKNERAV